MRVLTISHSHPGLSHGGGEIAAFQLHRHLGTHPGLESIFLGCDANHRHGRPGVSFTQPFGADEYLYQTGAFHWFNFANREADFPARFTALLRDLAPDIIHFHHYIRIGVEALAIARRALPHSKIMLTLHEFLAICHQHGQMVTPSHRLCRQATPNACQRCFPDHTSGDFFLRQRYIQRFLDQADAFIAPSQFLADRYRDWGLAASRLHVIENLIADPQANATPPSSQPRGPLRFGFFGQISILKGIDLLLDAAARLQATGCAVEIVLHGDFSNQPPTIQTHVQHRLASLPPNVRYHGAYANRDTDRLMQQVDAVIMPSIWWENSPVVIQEALRNRRPVLCPALGGMAEKVRDGLDGFHFEPGSATDLARLIEDCAAGRKNLPALQMTLQPPPTAASILNAHLALYQRLNLPEPVAGSPIAHALA